MLRVVTDSICDLPESIVAGCGIRVVPLYLNFGAESYLDGVELSRQDFYRKLTESEVVASTAAEHLLPEGEVPIIDITPVIGAHVGPGTVGFAGVQARDR